MYTYGIANFFAKTLDNPFHLCYNSVVSVSFVLTYVLLGLLIIFMGVVLSEFILEWLEVKYGKPYYLRQIYKKEVKKWYREYKKHYRVYKSQKVYNNSDRGGDAHE